MKPLFQVLRDLEFAAGQGLLTPSFMDSYALRHGEKVLALYSLASRNGLAISHEEGRNDHLEEQKEWHSTIDPAAVERELDAHSADILRSVRDAVDDGRPACLRKRSRTGFYPITPGH